MCVMYFQVRLPSCVGDGVNDIVFELCKIEALISRLSISVARIAAR